MDRERFDQTTRAFKQRKPFTVSMENGDRLKVDQSDSHAIRDGQRPIDLRPRRRQPRYWRLSRAGRQVGQFACDVDSCFMTIAERVPPLHRGLFGGRESESVHWATT